MSRLESWVLAFIPDRDQFLFQQGHHIILVFLRGQTEKDSTDMCSHCKIDFILMLCGMCFQHRTVYHGFRYVIGNEFCPDLLFDVLCFIGMKIAQPYRVFQLSKRRFDSPSGIV